MTFESIEYSAALQFAMTGDAGLLAATEERVLRLLSHREAAAAVAARRDIWETEVRSVLYH